MKELDRGNSSFITGCYIILTLACLMALGPYYNFQQIVLSVLVPFLSLLALRKDIYTFRKHNVELTIFLLIVVLTFGSVFLNTNFDLFFPALYGLVGALIAGYAAVGLNKNNSYEVYFHIGYVVSVVILILIELGLGNFSLSGFASVKASRGRFFFNANYYSYITFFANFSLFFLHQKYKNSFLVLLSLVLPVLFIILAFITQSRSGLFLIIFINVVYWFFIFKPTDKSKSTAFIKTVFSISAGIYLAFQFLSIYENSQIKSRITSSKEDSRGALAFEAIEVFTDNPFTGVGLGQFPRYSKFGQFSHNSYTEILAEHGIIGGVLLLLLFIFPTIKSYRLLSKDWGNPIYKVNFMFFVTFIIYNNAYVFYKVSFSMIYFFLVITIQNKTLSYKT
jgi:O-antigen ligase